MTDGRRMTGAMLVIALFFLAGCDRLTSEETRMARASASLQKGEYQAALLDLRKLLDSNPHNVDAQLLLVDALTASGDNLAARRQLDEAIAAGAPATATESRQINLLLFLADRDGARKTIAAS